MLLASRCVSFGDFRFNVPTRELLRVETHGSATPISLGSRAADLLHLFLHRPGELITKSEIMDAVWPNMAVEESNLTVQVSALRRALGVGRNGAGYIQTVPGRGYRFTPWVNDFVPRAKEPNGSETSDGTAGLLKAETGEGLPLLASPESVPARSRQPRHVVSPQIHAGDVTTSALQRHRTNIWWLFWLQGMAGIILGLMLLAAPDLTTVALVSFVGMYWFIMGILALVRVFVDQSVPRLWPLVAGIVGILAGIAVTRHPLLAALTAPTAIVIVLGVLGLIIGAIEIAGVFMGGGITSFILASTYLPVALLLLGSPIAAELAAPTAFGVLFLVQGVALTAFAFTARA
jgi:DNA-binding winged helix-turn-helix (wHTH) protein/uncharacterized membrane protein HdeD (DUF308 family)